MDQGVRIVLRLSFCSNLKIPNNVAKPFSTKVNLFFQENLVRSVSWGGVYALRGNGSSKEVNFCSSKMALVHCQLKACILDAFESCSQVGDEVISIIGCDADIVTYWEH